MKKIIALILICCMVLPMISASAATTEEPTPTIEEILNEYHVKAFEAQATSESGGASTYTRGGNGQTLEQQAVDALIGAGYEAYNITAENYISLEQTLKTNLSEMALDPNVSYIVIVSSTPPGESPTTNNPNSRVVQPPAMEDFDGDSSSFIHIHDGDEYIMRYVTVTSLSDSRLVKPVSYNISAIPDKPNYLADLLQTGFYALVDEAIPFVSLGTISSLLNNWSEESQPNNLVNLQPNTLVIHAQSNFNHSYIQVWNSNYSEWRTAECSTYANSIAYCAGTATNETTGMPDRVVGKAFSWTTYSYKYNNIPLRLSDAVYGFLRDFAYYTYIPEISFYYAEDMNEINHSGDDEPLFVIEEPCIVLIPERSPT